MIFTELLHLEPMFIVRATVGEFSAHGSGPTVEAAEDLALQRAHKFEQGILAQSKAPSVAVPELASIPAPNAPIQARVLNTGNSHNTIATGPAHMAQGVRISQLKAETDVELKRLKWSNDYAATVLEHNFKKKKRGDLTLEEYESFAAYLKSLPTPE